MLPIKKKLIQYNFTADVNRPVYIVVHDTGNTSVGANAEMHYRYFNGGDRQASAHFFVDDKEIIQTVEIKDKSWHCGDGGGRFGIANHNSIGIEICINSDGNYQQALSNTVDLIVWLMLQYNIRIDKVCTHYMASHKNCPGTMNKDGRWTAWTEFKKRVEDEYNFQKIVSNPKLISTPDYWRANCKDGGFIDGAYLRVLLFRYTNSIALCTNIDDVLLLLKEMQIIPFVLTMKMKLDYSKRIKGAYVRRLLIAMGSKL